MPFPYELQKSIREYVYGHLPDDSWYDAHFYPFIQDAELRDRLIIEFKNARVIYKIFEGLQAEKELLLSQIKTQVVMYVSIQEAAINYVLFKLLQDEAPVQELLFQDRLIKISIPKNKLVELQSALCHDGKDIVTCYNEKKEVDKTKIRFDQKVNTCSALGLIDSALKNDLIKLYEYRNTVHLEAELHKNLKYSLEMGQLAFKRVEGLSIQLVESLKKY
jgi:hypothetical protein